MAEVKIYSAVVCPFAHRSRLVLQEKGIDFDLIEIDLQNKPVGFTEALLHERKKGHTNPK
ncbi:glutathione S-transferase N-terminal domain-containing protein [Nostoc sp. LEGE 06077]|uniref:glutathione S-transferase N-terminal domain-containing protein n=1 Tax=Nostoc sp. LEGE 06077 TaxID=915325 RepID=UPI001D137A68|nr:glutathione S-transferase N-terminal domain-containing protein [Nostoc sp. LEGE 06077]